MLLHFNNNRASFRVDRHSTMEVKRITKHNVYLIITDEDGGVFQLSIPPELWDSL